MAASFFPVLQASSMEPYDSAARGEGNVVALRQKQLLRGLSQQEKAGELVVAPVHTVLARLEK
jgi:hypothetical protein